MESVFTVSSQTQKHGRYGRFRLSKSTWRPLVATRVSRGRHCSPGRKKPRISCVFDPRDELQRTFPSSIDRGFKFSSSLTCAMTSEAETGTSCGGSTTSATSAGFCEIKVLFKNMDVNIKFPFFASAINLPAERPTRRTSRRNWTGKCRSCLR